VNKDETRSAIPVERGVRGVCKVPESVRVRRGGVLGASELDRSTLGGDDWAGGEDDPNMLAVKSLATTGSRALGKDEVVSWMESDWVSVSHKPDAGG
jgi:hypothetical protein